MRKLLLLALLLSSSAFATTIDGNELARDIVNSQKTTTSNNGSFAIVYGGQDISRGNVVNSQPAINIAPILVA